jgi:hypothetical protein
LIFNHAFVLSYLLAAKANFCYAHLMKLLLATNNMGKVQRFKMLLGHIDKALSVFTPAELGISAADVEETGNTLLENALLKAKAYEGLVDMPILSNDTGFYVEGEGLVTAPKREALGDMPEHLLGSEKRALKKLLLNLSLR